MMDLIDFNLHHGITGKTIQIVFSVKLASNLYFFLFREAQRDQFSLGPERTGQVDSLSGTKHIFTFRCRKLSVILG